MPAVVGFASGGYFAVERLWAALAAHGARRRGRVGGTAAGAAHGRAGGSRSARSPGCSPGRCVSRAWAPLAGPAIADVQRLALYLATLVAAAAVLRGRWARAAEPALAAGAVRASATGSRSGCCRA